MTLAETSAVTRALFIAAVLGPGVSTGAMQAPTFSADVGVVRIDVAVVDEAGVPVDDLDPGEFVVLEGGLRQELTVFASPREAPLDVALLMDVSGSVEAYSGDIKASADAFLNLLSPTDCVYFRLVPQKAARRNWVGPFDQSLRDELGTVRAGGSTDMYDAVIEVLHELALRHRGYTAPLLGPNDPRRSTPRPEAGCAESGTGGSVTDEDPARFRRQAVVLLSDGNDTSSNETSSGVLTMIWEAQVPVFSIAVGGARSLGSRLDFLIRSTPPSRREALPSYVRMVLRAQERHRARLTEMARISGGELIIPANNQLGQDGLAQAYSILVNRLRASYLLGYAASAWTRGEGSPVPPWRDIEVTTTRPGTRVITRDGYYQVPGAGLRARALVREAREDARRGELESALATLERAGRADPGLWDVHYLRGIVYGMLGNWRESVDHLTRGLELNPGLARAHEALAEAAWRAGDFSRAWNHAIRATLAGSPTGGQQLQKLARLGFVPDGLETRLRVPRAFVGEPDVLDLPGNLLLNRLLVAVRGAVSESSELGLVRDASLADLFITIEVHELSPEHPHRFEGSLRASAPGQAASAFNTRIVADLAEQTEYRAAAAAAIGELQAWARESPGGWRNR